MKPFVLLFFFFTLVTQAQFQINGIVNDASTNKPLPFAVISISEGKKIISDVDGKFTLFSKQKVSEFKVSYTGFNSALISINASKKFYTVNLVPKSNDLNGVLISEKNPALEIIKKAIQNKDRNDPQKILKTFEFKTYNNLIVTANPDSISGRLDSVFKRKNRKFSKIDSSDYKFKKIIRKQHLFQTEKVSRFQFNKNGLKETVIASKMAGFNEPVYEVLGFNFQSFSIYDADYELLETKYNSPIASDGLRFYDFKLLDTVVIENRKAAMIYFKNKKEKNEEGLEGILYIDLNNFAVAKAVMRLRNILNITGIHQFKYFPKDDIWFPVGKSFKIVKGVNEDDIKILGGTIQFKGDTKNFKSRKKVASDFTYLLSETNYSEIVYNIPITTKKSFIAIDVEKDAANKREAFWNNYRKDSLDVRSKRTYKVLDSISLRNQVESRLRLGRKVVNGYLPFGILDLDLRYFFTFNNLEGFRLGFGGITNERLSKNFKIDTYTAYGTRDGKTKYSLGASIRTGKSSSTWIGGGYTDDIKEIASIAFATDRRIYKLLDPRQLNLSTFYHYLGRRAYIETKIIPKTQSTLEVTTSAIEPQFFYIFNVNNKLFTTFNVTTAIASFQWNPYSDYMQTPNGRIEIHSRFPKFTFQYTHSLPDVLGNDFNFGKIDARVNLEKKYLNGQKTALFLQGGYAFGETPMTHLYSVSPNSLSKDNIIQRITFSGGNSFETMYFNEFFSSEYAFFQLKHGFKRVAIFKNVKPVIVFATRAAWGDMKNPGRHIGFDYKTLTKGYFESGIELNKIYKGLGLSGFYRYGPNQLARFEDNIAVKLIFTLDLGI